MLKMVSNGYELPHGTRGPQRQRSKTEALVRCMWCGEVWINVRHQNYEGLVRCRRCHALMRVKLEEERLKRCELVEGGEGLPSTEGSS